MWCTVRALLSRQPGGWQGGVAVSAGRYGVVTKRYAPRKPGWPARRAVSRHRSAGNLPDCRRPVAVRSTDLFPGCRISVVASVRPSVAFLPTSAELCRLPLRHTYLQLVRFCRAMHFSAKRGIEIACRPSVCLSVCDVGGSGPQRLEILETNCTDN